MSSMPGTCFGSIVKSGGNFLATGPKIRQLMKFDAPTSMYLIACHCSTCNAPFASNDEFVPTSLIDSGAVAFVAPHTCQSISFWRHAPKMHTIGIMLDRFAADENVELGNVQLETRLVSRRLFRDAAKGCATLVYRHFPEYRSLFVGFRVIVSIPRNP